MTISRSQDFVRSLRRLPFFLKATKQSAAVTTWTSVFKTTMDLTNISNLVLTLTGKMAGGNPNIRLQINAVTVWTHGAFVDGDFIVNDEDVSGYSGNCTMDLQVYNSGANNTWAQDITFYNRED